MGPVTLGRGYNRITHPGRMPLSPGEQLITYVRTINWNQSEPKRTIPPRTKQFLFSFTCTYWIIFYSNENQSSIKLPNNFRFKWIHMQVPNNFWFEWKSELSIQARTALFSLSFTCTYQTISDLNEHQSSIKVPNNFRIKWKSELNQSTEQFTIQINIRSQSNM